MADIKFDEELRESLYSGAKQLADVVVHNYGPTGRNTIMDQTYDLPIIANSGRKVLTEFTLEDKFESVGAELIRDAALKIGQECGDGAIVTTILTNALLQQGYRMITAGYNPMLMRKGVRKALEAAIAMLHGISVPCDDVPLRKTAARIAKDEELGDLVIRAYEAVGAEGTISVLDSQGLDTKLHISDGIRYEYGLYASAFAEKEVTKSVEYQNPRILLVNYRIKDIAEIGNMVVQASQAHVPLVMVVEDIDDSVKQVLAANVAQKRVRLAVCKAPGHGEARRRNMFALSAKTGAVVFEEIGSRKLSDCGLESCGEVENAYIDMHTTTFRGFPLESTEMVELLMGLVKRQLAQTTAEYEIETLQDTISILNGKSAQIIAGGVTEYEMFDKKYLLENTVNAVQNMARYGILPGGGKSYLLASMALDPLISDLEGDEKEGARCLQAALQQPLKQLADNSGLDGNLVLHKLLDRENVWLGYDTLSGELADLKEKGIVESVKITEEILKTSVGTAASLWTTTAAVIES